MFGLSRMIRLFAHGAVGLALLALLGCPSGGGGDGGYGGGNGPVPPGDTTAPTVSSASPAANTESVAVDATVSATFSEAMDFYSITASTFTVSSGGAPVAGAVSYSGATASFTPSSSLAANTTYTATITTGAKDLAGNPIAATYSWSFTTGIWNRIFVTSVTGNGNLASWADTGGNTGLAAGDAICQARAAAAGLANPGNFRAWLSDDNDDAYCRIHGLTGKRSANCGQVGLPASAGPWMRTDGFPFAAPITELLNNAQVYAPVRFDEFGTRVTDGVYFTGTYIDGSRHPSFPSPCTNWTSSSASVIGSGGDTETTSYNWTLSGYNSCSVTNIRLLCMQTGAGPSLPSLATSGKKVFLTSTTGTGNLGSWPEAGSNSGLAAGDAICRTRATAAGLANADRFKAWLSSSTTDAKDRIVSDGPWVRLDGVPVAENKADLLDGTLFTSINLSEDGGYHGNQIVWSGTTDNGVKNANTCNDWTDGTSGYIGATGLAMYAGPGWSVSGSTSCDFSFSRLRCFED